ncbi:exo-alpha-sialidase [Paenibacillus cymbidii]|uniref:exo-alpha-sialidase n=1 Tax=Paenibacillus cymbidii TaxID=1639034 RepID=UPI001080F855|nr:exo-alpha-sialidase [Paenibacillus cymbidii]
MSKVTPLQHVEIYRDAHYNSFPSAVRLPDGSFRLSFRQAPDRRAAYDGMITHLDASSKGVSLSSKDGIVWDAAASVIWDDFFHGVQDPCLNVLSDGTLFATYFTWKVYEEQDAPPLAERSSGAWTTAVQGRWVGQMAGTYSIRSTDGGATWDRPLPAGLGDVAVRGNSVELPDGAILTPFYGQEGDTHNVVVGRTVDRGQTWERLAVLPGYEGQYHFHEPNLFRTAGGKVVLFIRSVKLEKTPGEEHLASPLFTSESTDGGRTWSPVEMWPIYSPSPFNALQLADGRVLLNYGYRLKPFGVRALVLDAECTNLGSAEEFVVRDDGLGGDIGYTSAVQLADGRVLITYYYYLADGVRFIAGSLCAVE